MYNAEQKKKFIAESTESVRVQESYTMVFNRCGSYEEEIGKDLCTMNDDEVITALAFTSGPSSQSQTTTMSRFRTYAKWCVKNNIPNARTFEGIKCDGEAVWADKIRRQMVANPKHLQNYLDIICDDESENTNDNVVRCYFWLGFSGIESKDAFCVRASDVSLRNMVVRYNGKEYELYKEGLTAIEKCMTLTEICRPNAATGAVAVYKRAPGDIILRGVSGSEKPKESVLKSIVSHKIKKSNIKASCSPGSDLSYTRVQKSGIFYRTYEAERIGIKPDFMAMARVFTWLPENEIESKEITMVKLASECKKDYERWKHVFSA